MAGGDGSHNKGNEAGEDKNFNAKESTQHLAKLQDDSLFSKVDRVKGNAQPKDSTDNTSVDDRIKEIAEAARKSAEGLMKSLSVLEKAMNTHPELMAGLMKASEGVAHFEQTLIKGLMPPTNEQEKQHQQQMLAKIKSTITDATKTA